jgi:Domain of unknown function (DUF4124)
MLNTLGSLAHTLLILWLSVTAGPIYKYVDDQGNVTYSNSPRPGAKIIVLDPAPPPASAAPSPPRSGDASPAREAPRRQAVPNNFPRVDSDTQRKRDLSRRNILEEELRNEQKALDEAKQALKEGEATRLGNERNYQKYLDRVQGLKDTVETHQKNVEAIRKELGNL